METKVVERSGDAKSITSAPGFVHEKEFADARRVVTMIAAGRNPFSEEPFDTLRPQQRDSVLQALCILAVAPSGTALTSTSVSQANVAPLPDVPASAKRPLVQYLERVERDAILEALVECNYNQTAAARLLGITFRALRYRLERLEIDVSGT